MPLGFMGRGLRNIYRNRARTLIVMLVLGLSVSVALVMSSVEKNVSGRLEALRSDVGTQLELRPAGSYGISHSSDDKGVKYLPETMVPAVSGIESVRAARASLSMMGDFNGEHVIVMGIEPGARLSIFGGSVGRLKSGTLLDAYSGTDAVVLVGDVYAKKHNANIGDKIMLKDSEVTVVGTFSSDTAYGDHGIFTPIGNIQRIFGLDGRVSSVFVDVDSIGNVDSVISKIKDVSSEASAKVDVVDKDKPVRDGIAASFSNVAATSRLGAILALAVGSAIVFFTMLLVTRERRREIGTLKAIGASDADIIKQFFAETAAVALGAAVLGLLLTQAGGGAAASSFFPNPASAASKDVRNMGIYASDSGVISSAAVTPVEFGFDASSIAYAAGVAFLLGIAGMLYPAIRTFGLSPAEALRHE